jgi:predicted alpha/beta-hydrolase family hydrolase
VNLLTTGPDGATTHLILSHGAGAPMTSPFMDEISALLAARGISVTRFEFAYMAARRRRRSASSLNMPKWSPLLQRAWPLASACSSAASPWEAVLQP